MTRRKENIVDASAPVPGRVYDYFLGGNHNFEVDRKVARQVLKLLPFAPKAARLQRWCLQDVARELTEVRGYDTIVDFASGLPTADHLHTAVKPGTTVIYSDYDPIVVEYAHEILGGTPNVYFFEADARRPEELLERAEVRDILGDRRDVALAYWGISNYLTDEELVHAARTLYDWAGPDSCWAFNAQGADMNPDDPAVAEVVEMCAQAGYPLILRRLEAFKELIGPWRPDGGGFVSMLEWHGLDQSVLSKEDHQSYGPAGAGYGAFLVK
jgi:SAM-dependent methyltransferase